MAVLFPPFILFPSSVFRYLIIGTKKSEKDDHHLGELLHFFIFLISS